MIATNFWEPVADTLESRFPTYTYVLDFFAQWGLFFLAFGVLRLVSDLLTRYQLNVDLWVELLGRSVLSIAIAWVFLCFALFTLHTAPLAPGSLGFQEHADSKNFGLGPDRMWLAFVQSRSRGALADFQQSPGAPEYDAARLHPDDRDLNCRVFDSYSDYIYQYHHRRDVWSQEEQLRVFRRTP